MSSGSQDQSSEGIVLRRFDSSESDRRLILLTAEFGKVSAVAKGARKSGSRLAGSSEPLTRAVFGWAAGRNQRFITQVQPLSSYSKIRGDYDRLMIGLAMTELADAVLPSDVPAADIYDLLVRALEALQDSPPLIAYAWYSAIMLDREGVWPNWTACSNTNERLAPGTNWVSGLAQGPVGDPHMYPDAIEVSWEALVGLKRLVDLDAPPAAFSAVLGAVRTLDLMWRTHLDRQLSVHQSLRTEWFARSESQ